MLSARKRKRLLQARPRPLSFTVFRPWPEELSFLPKLGVKGIVLDDVYPPVGFKDWGGYAGQALAEQFFRQCRRYQDSVIELGEPKPVSLFPRWVL